MLSEDETNEQLQLLATYRRTLAVYLRQRAAIGEAYSPPGLLNGIHETRHQIQLIKGRLQAAGVAVPEDPDDEEPSPPPPRPAAPARRAPWTPIAIGALALLVVGAVAGLLSQGLLPGQPTAQPASTSPAAEQPTPAATVEGDPLYRYSFQSGRADGWSGEAQTWQVVPDGDRYVYQGQPEGEFSASSPSNTDDYAELSNYAIQMRVRVARPGPTTDELADLWISLRARGDAGPECETYNFYLFSQSQEGGLGLVGGESCPFDFLDYNTSVNFTAGRWHTLRAEAVGDELRLLLDGELALSAQDGTLDAGFFYLTVGPGAIVQFDDISVYELAP